MSNEARAVNIYKEQYDVYIGRDKEGNVPMLPHSKGYFGNPIAIGKPCIVCGGRHNSGGSTLPCYKRYLRLRLRVDAQFRRELEKLRGKRLGCFCHPKPCHGDILAEYLNATDSSQ